MKPIKPTLALLAVLFCLGCSKPNRTLQAEPGQAGAGATITISGDHGELMVPASNGMAKISERIVDVEMPPSLGEVATAGYPVSMRLETRRLKLEFVKIGKAYICRNCHFVRLPQRWYDISE